MLVGEFCYLWTEWCYGSPSFQSLCEAKLTCCSLQLHTYCTDMSGIDLLILILTRKLSIFAKMLNHSLNKVIFVCLCLQSTSGSIQFAFSSFSQRIWTLAYDQIYITTQSNILCNRYCKWLFISINPQWLYSPCGNCSGLQSCCAICSSTVKHCHVWDEQTTAGLVKKQKTLKLSFRLIRLQHLSRGYLSVSLCTCSNMQPAYHTCCFLLFRTLF